MVKISFLANIGLYLIILKGQVKRIFVVLFIHLSNIQGPITTRYPDLVHPFLVHSFLFSCQSSSISDLVCLFVGWSVRLSVGLNLCEICDLPTYYTTFSKIVPLNDYLVPPLY